MRLLRVKVSKEKLEEIKQTKELSFVVDYEEMFKVFCWEGDDYLTLEQDPDYEDLYVMENFDGIVLLQCRSKFPYRIVTAYPEYTGMCCDANDDLKEQKVYYKLGDAITEEEMKGAEIVKL